MDLIIWENMAHFFQTINNISIADICLLENNVRMAARLAVEYAKMKNNVPMSMSMESPQNLNV